MNSKEQKLNALLSDLISAKDDIIEFAAVKAIESSPSGVVPHADMEAFVKWALDIVTTATLLLVALRPEIAIKVIDNEVCFEKRERK